MGRVSRFVALFGALIFVLLASSGPAAADTAAAVAFLATTQQANGGWDANPATEFATTEAILAIAEAAQTGAAWSTAQAFAAVDGFNHSAAPNNDPLHFADDMADGAIPASVAGKLIVLVAAPLGLPPTDFDPKNDSAAAVNLETALDPNGCAGNLASFGFFGETLVAMMAKFLLCGTAPPQRSRPCAARNRPTAPGTSRARRRRPVSTTSTRRRRRSWRSSPGGVAPTDPDVVEGLAFLATKQSASGAWEAFGFPSPESTSRSILAVTAAGYDPTASCWRDAVAPALAGTAYASPVTALDNLQNANGSWGTVGPNFSTGQAIQGLERQWLPVARGPVQTCVLAAPPAVAPGAPPTPAAPAGGTSPGGTALPAGAVLGRPNFTG